MKIKSLFISTAFILGLANFLKAQLPNNIPTNNLEVYYSFENNSNDYLGNCNGVNFGANLTNDANGNANSAYSFNGSTDYIDIPAEFVNGLSLSSQTFRIKFKIDQSGSFTLWCKDGSWQEAAIYIEPDNSIGLFWAFPNYYSGIRSNVNTIQLGIWNDVFIIISNNIASMYINGIQQITYQGINVTSSTISYSHSGSCAPQIGNNRFGFSKTNCSSTSFHLGEIDEFGLWSRELTTSEIVNISLPCSQTFTLQPNNQTTSLGLNVQFTANSSNATADYQWQTNPLNLGWIDITNNSNYSGVNSNSLTINNVQISNQNQVFRVITTSGNCIDTSDIALINILDTCITNITVYDTILTTVTDTLLINAQLTGINPPINNNILKIFPNPANTHITINYGNFSSMSGYTLNIVNSIGQTVFTTPINQQTSYIDLSTWTGSGIYYVQLIDTQNNTIENRKIVIQ
jgi:hypothetical protein